MDNSFYADNLMNATYITLNLHRIPGVLHVQGVGQQGVVVEGLFIIHVGGNLLSLSVSLHSFHNRVASVPSEKWLTSPNLLLF